MSSSSKTVVDWQRRNKRRAIIYKGGCCLVCGYARCQQVMNFHHLDKQTKDFAISGAVRSWEKTKAELDKCVLLCANCHGEVHADLIQIHNTGPTPEEGLALLMAAGLAPEEPRNIKAVCFDCGKSVSGSAATRRCVRCAGKHRPSKIIWPSKAELETMIQETNMNQVSKKLGISYAALRKHLSTRP